MESQYKAHLATHVTCQMPGCTFSASQRVVKDHIATAHGDGNGLGPRPAFCFRVHLHHHHEIRESERASVCVWERE